MIAASIGSDVVTIYDVLQRVYGRQQAREALQNPDDDPDFVRFALELDTLVNRDWERRGVSRLHGPYVSQQ